VLDDKARQPVVQVERIAHGILVSGLKVAEAGNLDLLAIRNIIDWGMISSPIAEPRANVFSTPSGIRNSRLDVAVRYSAPTTPR
jgi:hypothetical protein